MRSSGAIYLHPKSMDIESIKKELPLKKKELDSKFNVDPQKSTIRIDDDTSVGEA